MIRCFIKHKVTIKGVIHAGGHLGEEYPIYKKAGAEQIVFFEPVPDTFEALSTKFKGRSDVILVQKALGSKNEKRRIYIAKGGRESTSFLKPMDLYDGHFEETPIFLDIIKLDSLFPSLMNNRCFNTLVTDVQGFDLEVLKGSKNTLGQIDYVYTEVSNGHYHREPALHDSGDVFYIRDKASSTP